MAKRKYNLIEVIGNLCDSTVGDLGLATEIDKEMRKRDKSGNLKSREGIVLPDVELLRDMNLLDRDEAQVPDFGTGNDMGHGHNVVSTDLLLGNFIESLAARTSLGRAGITHIGGLVGDVGIPKLTEDITADWITAEGGDATKTCPTVGQVSMTPHTLAAYTDITRRMLIQTSSWAERFIIGLLKDATRRAVEAAVFNGSGTSGVPAGILGLAGINTVSLTPGAITRGNLLDFVEKLETANVDVSTDCAWIGSPAVKKLLASTIDLTVVKNVEGTENVGGVATKYLFADGKAEDFPFIASGLVAAKKLVFAKWSDIVLGSWGGVSITVDKYTLATSGTVRVVVLSDWDVAVRHAESIAVGTALS